MSDEVYQVRTIWQYASKRSRITFYFQLDNFDDGHSWAIAREVANSLFVATNWGARLADLITQHAFMRQLDIWRVSPQWSAGYRQRLPSVLYPGGWSGQSCDNFITANIRWHHDADRLGKHQSRIGPLGAGATTATGWWPLFGLAAMAFGVEHVTPKISSLGYHFRSVNMSEDGSVFPITNFQVCWPPGRQANRRLVR